MCKLGARRRLAASLLTTPPLMDNNVAMPFPSALPQQALAALICPRPTAESEIGFVFAAARKKSATVPVILMTGFGYDPSHSIVRASQEGLQAVLFKPFKVQVLLEEVRKALQQQPVG